MVVIWGECYMAKNKIKEVIPMSSIKEIVVNPDLRHNNPLTDLEMDVKNNVFTAVGALYYTIIAYKIAHLIPIPEGKSTYEQIVLVTRALMKSLSGGVFVFETLYAALSIRKLCKLRKRESNGQPIFPGPVIIDSDSDIEEEEEEEEEISPDTAKEEKGIVRILRRRSNKGV